MSERRNKKAKVFDCKSSRLLTVPSIFSPIAFTEHMNKMSNRNIWWKRLFHGEYICMDFRTYCYHHKIPDRIKATRHILTKQQYRMSGSYSWLVSVCMCMGTTASSLCSHWSNSEKKKCRKQNDKHGKLKIYSKWNVWRYGCHSCRHGQFCLSVEQRQNETDTEPSQQHCNSLHCCIWTVYT